jgi:hypothetical protein
MITEIGITAGDIWHYLDQHGKTPLKKLLEGIGVDRDRALMSIGWLAREGHVIVEGTSPDYQVYLRR